MIRFEGGFNGAAVVGPRKQDPSQGQLSAQLALQWGRGRWTAETSDGAGIDKSIIALQWGRGRWTAETHKDYLALLTYARDASMGPRSLDRGNRGAPSAWGVSLWGCNGAAVVGPRKHGGARVLADAGEASMGPRSLDRGNLGGGSTRSARSPGFNGAAVVGPRKQCRRFYQERRGVQGSFSSGRFFWPRRGASGVEAVGARALGATRDAAGSVFERCRGFRRHLTARSARRRRPFVVWLVVKDRHRLQTTTGSRGMGAYLRPSESMHSSPRPGAGPRSMTSI